MTRSFDSSTHVIVYALRPQQAVFHRSDCSHAGRNVALRHSRLQITHDGFERRHTGWIELAAARAGPERSSPPSQPADLDLADLIDPGGLLDFLAVTHVQFVAPVLRVHRFAQLLLLLLREQVLDAEQHAEMGLLDATLHVHHHGGLRQRRGLVDG